MSREEQNKLKFIVALVAELSRMKQLKPKQVFNYLQRFKGFDFLEKHYGILHTQSFEDVIESLLWVCHRNGGQLA